MFTILSITSLIVKLVVSMVLASDAFMPFAVGVVFSTFNKQVIVLKMGQKKLFWIGMQ